MEQEQWKDYVEDVERIAANGSQTVKITTAMVFSVDAELTTLRAEVERLTREREAERKAIAEALRAEFSDDFGLADRILAGEFAQKGEGQ